MPRGNWPCKIGDPNMDDGLEMVSTNPNPSQPSASDAGSPTSVESVSEEWTAPPTKMDTAAAAIIESMSQIVGPPTPESLKNASVQWGNGGMGHGGGVFASIRGAHSSWQAQKETEAATARHKAALTIALTKARAASGDQHQAPVRESRRERSTAECFPVSCAVENRSGSPGTPEANFMSGDAFASTKSLLASMSKASGADALPGLRASAFALMSKRCSKQDAKRKEAAPSRHAMDGTSSARDESTVSVEWAQERGEGGVRMRSCVTCIGQY